jgi:hypothetical protein
LKSAGNQNCLADNASGSPGSSEAYGSSAWNPQQDCFEFAFEHMVPAAIQSLGHASMGDGFEKAKTQY